MSLFSRLRKGSSHALLPCLLLNIAFSVPVFAAQPNSYDVEVVVFSYRYPADNGEQWPAQSVDAGMAAGSYTSNQAGNQVSELPVDVYKLNGISNGLRQSSNYSVLFHRAWRQPAYDDANAVSLPVQAVAESGRNNIEGSIRLIRERFLHLDADLQMTPAGNPYPVMNPSVPGSSPVYTLREKRRIKSYVVHYFDNPHFGMIATVTPYYSPEESQQLLEETRQEETAETEEIPESVPLPDDQLTR